MIEYSYLILGILYLIVTRMHYGMFENQPQDQTQIFTEQMQKRVGFYQSGLLVAYILIAVVYFVLYFHTGTDKLI